MFDFKKHLNSNPQVDSKDLLALFDSLDRHASHTTLRPVQIEALQELTKRREQRDIVLKVSTGGGKTIVGLLFLYSYMVETRSAVVYLCPTKQLVDQVLREAENLGIRAEYYAAREPHPHPDIQRGRAVSVCSYDYMFNSRSTFNREDVHLRPHAIVLDDAHAGIEEVRDAFRLTISSSDGVYRKLIEIVEEDYERYDSSGWNFMQRGGRNTAIEVPYWLWKTKLLAVEAALSEFCTKRPHVFPWEHLSMSLRWCRCLLSSDGIEIVPDLPLIQRVAPFAEAKHRLFTTATLSEDSPLVRNLHCMSEAAQSPLALLADGGIGERMILVPTLIDKRLNRDWVMSWCKYMFENSRYSIVVLCASEEKAKEWEPYGAHTPLGDNVQQIVSGLRSGQTRFVALTQRYDGVDLPDDACRILVIDGVPSGQGIADEFDSRIEGSPGHGPERTVYRLEQGMGRAVRSHVDYAVVVLAGPELASFIGRKEVRATIAVGTLAQLDLADEIIDMAKKMNKPEEAFNELAQQCLNRDPGWKQFYDVRVRSKSRVPGIAANLSLLTMADAEQRALQAATLGRDPQRAVEQLDKAMHEKAVILPNLTKGWYVQRLANYSHEFDPAMALEYQKQAHSLNTRLLTPQQGAVVRQRKYHGHGAAQQVLNWYRTFDKANGALAEVLVIAGRLVFSALPEDFEQGLCDLARVLGVEGSRPERDYRRGPDCLWRCQGLDWVIEAKNERDRIVKADAGQLSTSMEWHRTNYPERTPVPIIVIRNALIERDAFLPPDTRCITEDTLKRLLHATEQFVGKLAAHGIGFGDLRLIDQYLRENKLDQDSLLNNFTVVAKPR